MLASRKLINCNHIKLAAMSGQCWCWLHRKRRRRRLDYQNNHRELRLRHVRLEVEGDHKKVTLESRTKPRDLSLLKLLCLWILVVELLSSFPELPSSSWQLTRQLKEETLSANSNPSELTWSLWRTDKHHFRPPIEQVVNGLSECGSGKLLDPKLSLSESDSSCDDDNKQAFRKRTVWRSNLRNDRTHNNKIINDNKNNNNNNIVDLTRREKESVSWWPTRVFLWLNRKRSLVLLAEANSDANRLYEDLMMTYNRIVRPVQNDSDKVVVMLSLKLSQLIDMNLKNQMMTTNVWLNQEWFDYKLKWDPSEYGGIVDINLPAEQIWLPDIVLYNSAEGYFAVSIMTKAKVRHDGHVIWNPPAIFRSSCQIDITYFPFDSQNCHLKFGSWTYGAKIDLWHKLINDTEKIEKATDLSEYYQNVEWDIMRASAKRTVIYYDCCPDDPYPDLTFHFTLRRKPLFYTINLILPCIGITVLSPLVFYLPSDSGEKVTLTISTLVSLILFLSVLIETIPSTSLAMPLLGKYLVFTMCFITLSVCSTVFVLNIHFRTPSTHSMPSWVKRWYIDILPKYIFMNVPHQLANQLVLPEQLVYAHNSAYQHGQPQQVKSQDVAQQQTKNSHRQKSGHSNERRRSQSSSNHCCPTQADELATPSRRDGNGPAAVLQLQRQHSRNRHSANQQPAGLSPSPLFLPLLQSEAARRLQLQRSRSSDRDQRSTSDGTATQPSGSSAEAPPLRIKRTDSDKARSHSAARNVVAAATPKPDPEAGRRPPVKRKHKKTRRSAFLGWLFGRRSSTTRGAANETRSDHGISLATCSPTSSSSSDLDNDYQHHNHFRARASVCSNNLWRIGPTRRCSVAVPANYPTFYRPLGVAAPAPAPPPPPPPPQLPAHRMQSGDEELPMRELLLRHTHRRAGQIAAGSGRSDVPSPPPPLQSDLFPVGLNGNSRKSMVVGMNPPPLPPHKPPSRISSEQMMRRSTLASPASTSGGRESRLSQAPLPAGNSQRQQQHHLLNGPNVVAPSAGQSRAGVIYGHQGHVIQMMPRSRSNDQRLYSIQPMPATLNRTAPIPTPHSAHWASTSGSARLIQLRPPGANPVPLLASGSESTSTTLGRALGQVYLDRIQRRPPLLEQQQHINHLSGSVCCPGLSSAVHLSSSNSQQQPQQPLNQVQLGAFRRSRSQSSLSHSLQNRTMPLPLPAGVSLVRVGSKQQPHLADNVGQCCGCDMASYRQIYQPEVGLMRQRTSSGGPASRIQLQSGFNQPTNIAFQPTNQQQQQQTQSQAQQQQQLSTLGLMRLVGDVDRAIQNAMFIAQHIDNLDEFESVKENWKFIAMVIDRIFLIVFLSVCIAGTVAIFSMAPWALYATEQPIDLGLARLEALNLTATLRASYGQAATNGPLLSPCDDNTIMM